MVVLKYFPKPSMYNVLINTFVVGRVFVLFFLVSVKMSTDNRFDDKL